MPSIKDYLANLKGDKRKLVSNLINKGVNASNNETFTTLVNKVNSILTPSKPKDVNYYDYDGTIVASYTKDEFLSLTSHPANPEHAGLTPEGWNWTFATAQTYVQKYGILNLGQTYVTNDGSTRLYISLPDFNLSPTLYLNINGSVTVDWGDGTSDTMTGTSLGTLVSKNHVYSEAGDYVISISPDTTATTILISGSSYNNRSDLFGGGMNFSGDAIYLTYVTKIEFGTNVTLSSSTSSKRYNLCGLRNLKELVLSNSINYIGEYALFGTTKLKFLVLPNNNFRLSTTSSLSESAISQVIPSERTIQLDTVGSAGIRTFSSFSIPEGMTSIPDSLFNQIAALSKVAIPDTVTTLNYGVFYGTGIKDITLPDNLTTLGPSLFSNCQLLEKVTVPSRITTLSYSVFANCYSLREVTFLGDIASIGNNCFQNCSHLDTVDLTNCTSVPTLGGSGTGVFNGASANYKVLVPSDLYDTWKAETNWSSVASHIYPVDENGNILAQ